MIARGCLKLKCAAETTSGYTAAENHVGCALHAADAAAERLFFMHKGLEVYLNVRLGWFLRFRQNRPHMGLQEITARCDAFFQTACMPLPPEKHMTQRLWLVKMPHLDSPIFPTTFDLDDIKWLQITLSGLKICA
ncbi:hypothetical protein [Neisseria bacilliformis]|uniref:hypothetical protein n=1 Tax=Neisseria bacilliformis TaxID=267212 RepID=UPI00128B2F9A|nr:hypothetical protein [Neisseria bacilliformis]